MNVSSRTKIIFYRTLSLTLLVYWLLLIFAKNHWGVFKEILWLCNVLLPLLILALFFGKKRLLDASLLIILVIQTPWLIDITYYFITGYFLFPGVANYVMYQPELLNMVTSHHAFLPIIAGIILFTDKNLEKDSWKVATIIVSLVFFISFFLAGNINYVKTHSFLWFIIKLLGLTIIFFVLEKIIRKIVKKTSSFGCK